MVPSVSPRSTRKSNSCTIAPFWEGRPGRATSSGSGGNQKVGRGHSFLRQNSAIHSFSTRVPRGGNSSSGVSGGMRSPRCQSSRPFRMKRLSSRPRNVTMNLDFAAPHVHDLPKGQRPHIVQRHSLRSPSHRAGVSIREPPASTLALLQAFRSARRMLAAALVFLLTSCLMLPTPSNSNTANVTWSRYSSSPSGNVRNSSKLNAPSSSSLPINFLNLHFAAQKFHES